jgi:hypothetical protein
MLSFAEGEEMKRFLPALGIAVLFSCGPSDPNLVLVNGQLEVPPGKVAFHRFEIYKTGTFTLTFTPKGGEVYGWVSPGDNQPVLFVVVDPSAPPFGAKQCADGKEGTVTGTVGWGGSHVAVFNPGASAVKVRCKLTFLENAPK